MLVEQEPIGNEHERQHHMERDARDFEVLERVAIRCIGKQQVEHEEREENGSDRNELQGGGELHIAVLLAVGRLHEFEEHDGNAQVIRQVREIHVEHVVEAAVIHAEAAEYSHYAECTVERLENELSGSAPYHRKTFPQCP